MRSVHMQPKRLMWSTRTSATAAPTWVLFAVCLSAQPTPSLKSRQRHSHYGLRAALSGVRHFLSPPSRRSRFGSANFRVRIAPTQGVMRTGVKVARCFSPRSDRSNTSHARTEAKALSYSTILRSAIWHPLKSHPPTQAIELLCRHRGRRSRCFYLDTIE